MHDALQKELATYEKRTPKSAAAHKRALERIPLGVASNYRHYEPYPIFAKDGKAGRIHDVDGNEYIDHNLCFAALMPGHCHPAVVKAANWGAQEAPNSVAGGAGVPRASLENVLIASFNSLKSVERRFKENSSQIAAVILEPILMNVGLCLPQPGFLEGLRDLCDKNGALLIFDEVKTGAKLAWGGASDFFGVKPDMICLAKSIGGGLPLGAFGASRAVMDLIAQHKVFHGGTYNTNRVAMAAGLATFREVLTRENYAHVDKLSKKLTEGYRAIVKKSGLQAYVVSAGVNGALMLYPREIRNYRDWTKIDVDLWRHYWFGMVNRGVLAQPYWWDEQWTISVQHTEADIDKHLAVFEEIAPALAKAQQERGLAFVGAAGH